MSNSTHNKTSMLFGFLPDNPNTDEFIKGIWRDNPVFVQVLGILRVILE